MCRLKSFSYFEKYLPAWEDTLIDSLVCPKSLCLGEWSLHGAGGCPAVYVTFPVSGSLSF